ncbi:MAG: hypothetical protein LBG78_01390 [Azoarcus sp.]|jgi:hypothetical protein|nr:hypothetical protein [Azoarcus sp.]
MKLKKRKQRKSLSLSPRNFTNDFVRGTLASGIVAVIAQKNRVNRSVARAALQSGVALAGVTIAADALQQRCYFRALLAAAGATAGVYALQQLLPEKPALDA